MPIYEFECHPCGHRFEEIVGAGARLADGIACPKCKSPEIDRTIARFAVTSSSSSSASSAESCPPQGCGRCRTDD